MRAQRESMTSRASQAPRILLALLLLSAVGCHDGPTAQRPVGVLATTVSDAGGPIFRSLLVELDADAGIVVEYWPEEGQALSISSPKARSVHEIFLPRLRASSDYSYSVHAVNAAGIAGLDRSGMFRTDALPQELEEIQFSITGQATFDILLVEAIEPPTPYYPIVVDRDGNIMWYSLNEAKATAGSAVFADSLLALLNGDGIRVVSPASQSLVASLTRAEASQRTGINPFVIHHDVIATPNETLLFLVQDTSNIGDTVWTGDAIWEWDPLTDQLQKRWASRDFLDPATDRGPRTSPEDWLHANSLALGPAGNVVVSLFWTHEVLSIAPGFQALEWRLGGPASTFDVAGQAMEAGQHTAAEVEPNRVLLFDNGRDRAGGLFSRALEVELDRVGGRAKVVWEFRPSPDIYAPIISSARRLENGNTVVTFGLSQGWPPPEPGEPRSTGPLSLFEVTPEQKVVWRMDPVSGIEMIYRATPLTSIAGERPLG